MLKDVLLPVFVIFAAGADCGSGVSESVRFRLPVVSGGVAVSMAVVVGWDRWKWVKRERRKAEKEYGA